MRRIERSEWRNVFFWGWMRLIGRLPISGQGHGNVREISPVTPWNVRGIDIPVGMEASCLLLNYP